MPGERAQERAVSLDGVDASGVKRERPWPKHRRRKPVDLRGMGDGI